MVDLVAPPVSSKLWWLLRMVAHSNRIVTHLRGYCVVKLMVGMVHGRKERDCEHGQTSTKGSWWDARTCKRMSFKPQLNDSFDFMTTKLVLHSAYRQQFFAQHMAGTLIKNATRMQLSVRTNVLLMKGNPDNYVFIGAFCVGSRVDGQVVSWVYGRLRIESVGWTALVAFHSIPVLVREDFSAPSKEEQQVTWTASVMLQRSTLTDSTSWQPPWVLHAPVCGSVDWSATQRFRAPEIKVDSTHVGLERTSGVLRGQNRENKEQE